MIVAEQTSLADAAADWPAPAARADAAEADAAQRPRREVVSGQQDTQRDDGQRVTHSASMRYATIVADPPWEYDSWPIHRGARIGQRMPIPYPTMSVDEIAALPIGELAQKDAHLYLWTTQRYLGDAFAVARRWGFRYSTTLVWAKPPCGIGPGGTYAPNAEFVLFCRRGSLKAKQRLDTCWWSWARTHEHSRKPDAFLDLVESTSPGPYLELFARRQRLGWDTWGDEALAHVEIAS